MANEAGGRMQLRLVESADDRARYSVELTTSSGAWSASADVDRAGQVELGDFGATPPSWLLASVRALLRSIARSAAAGARVGPGASWPRRIQRWRAEP